MRASVLPQPDPGFAILRITELDASPEGLTLSIQRQQGPDAHLADDGWRRTEAWLLPEEVKRTRQGLEFQLGPEICDRLAGIATVRLRVREPDIGVVGATVLAWPAMLTSGAIDPSSRTHDDTVRLRRKRAPEPTPPPAPPFQPKPEPAAEPSPPPELHAARDLPAEPDEGRGVTAWLIAALLLVIVAGAGYYAYVNYFEHKPTEEAAATSAPPPEPQATAASPPATPAAAEAPKKSVREEVGAYLATHPAPDALLAKAKEYADKGAMSAAFLVWRSAAETGSVPAELALAQFYDPLSPQPKSGFTADGVRAADWYERAALAGNAEAQRKYGELLVKGGAGLSPDPAKARNWLQQAAAQNDAEAKKVLDALPK